MPHVALLGLCMLLLRDEPSESHTLYGAWFTAGVVVVYMGMVASFVHKTAPDRDLSAHVGLDSNFVSLPVLEAKL
ncbi:hypothetical protein SPRG_00882 [Saprolegnia parasitica CBS 223.65]|uniref:Uncharacterized protein n=1 Tax=Saprolegnia parasitica (strain CBS 223.65) TaxID=695850 RepID=A0A067D833_SAPPC|nr:hypothetical protein SPRG_00882 [Saprolegnia parasitica CBS 223.65]KDO34821.1 hypothetical protein SPRG_00882 [Saprolegnia parasitica CBS 223.65]|eukprot:XP_012194485.1 hypothetical protein SPRG_00882 [Saprolegnia parasitica CBS 223.65]